ncbi:ubiquitin carboxyl-terminal hydrolase 32-like isoform X2 [Branchiostoma lanceolatum]|uniref:ubiquitin carboxyl-terminal hydrolase 32-like isoform X2 n=1 Tax=Branchiostoma lanceolatum TaxID=7740 RepID=UPI003456E393
MGGRESKPSFISYEEAIKRVTNDELERLKAAFKRSSNLNALMTKPVFMREVLGDSVPGKLAERIYEIFGGNTKGLKFPDMVCGLVLLTRGKREEKIKFIFALYANDALSHVQRSDMETMVLACDSGHVPQVIKDSFAQNERLMYDEFRCWLLANPDATSVTRWLLNSGGVCVTLTDDSETPTFYQTLAGVTHLEETDIIELEKRYWQLKSQSKTGRFDLETFTILMVPPVPKELCEGLFNAFDENRDNHIDFKEICCGLSACCRGPLAERQKFCFKIFDTNHDGLLDREELVAMATMLIIIHEENVFDIHTDPDMNKTHWRAEDIVKDILKTHDTDQDGCITLEEYQIWSMGHRLPNDLLKLLFQVCHVVLGLRPAWSEEEGEIVRGWLDREERKGLRNKDTWYLVSMAWWKNWCEFTHYQGRSYHNGWETSSNSSSGSLPPHHLNGLAHAWDEISEEFSQDEASSVSRTSGFYSESSSAVESLRGNGTLNHVANHIGDADSRRTSSVSSGSRASTMSSEGRGTLPRKHLAPNPLPPQNPGAIDNTQLIIPETRKVMMLTNEGGRLKRDRILIRGRDYELLPEPVWRALQNWYGGSPALPRTVIIPSHGDPTAELELYPLSIRLLRHQAPQTRAGAPGVQLGGFHFGPGGITGPMNTTPRRYLAYVAAFSRMTTLQLMYQYLCNRLRIREDDMRLWNFKEESNAYLLEEEDHTLEMLGIEDNQQILIEVRNKDMSWPEEMSSLANQKNRMEKKQAMESAGLSNLAKILYRNSAAAEKGATGLSNLGNTCFMNSGLQCISNTHALTEYFISGRHLYELNTINPLGMKGHIARRYGDLVQDLWSGTSKTIAPLKMRWTIAKYAPRFNGFQQHDSQELLAFLLDGLHEDLNRVHEKPYVELKDSDGRPDEEVAKEAWDNHLMRNRSIVVDLFHGQLKSQVSCRHCTHINVRFDPFNFMSLPLPMDNAMYVEVTVMKLDGSVPVRYGLRLNADEKNLVLKKQLGELCDIDVSQLLLLETFGATIKSFPSDGQRVRSVLGGNLFAYEIPPVQNSSTEEESEGKAVETSEPSKPQCNGTVMTGAGVAVQPLPPVNIPPVKDDTSLQPSPAASNKPAASLNRSTNGNQQLPARQGTLRRTTHLPAVNGDAGYTLSQPGNGRHSRQPSNASTSTTSSVNGQSGFNGFVVALHRKMIRMDVYFLSSQKSRPSLFGTPLILPCGVSSLQQDLYQAIWTQVSRLVSPLPPSEGGRSNHAQDWSRCKRITQAGCAKHRSFNRDDSLGYEYPFVLKAVQRDGITCAWCPWYRFCRGCVIDCTEEEFAMGSSYVAIDWDPTALHLRYQESQEKVFEEHESVAASRRAQSEPIDLDTCLKAFTKEEELGEEERWYCSKCQEHQLAAKKLDIWRLPPILIVHMKRFQFLNGRWCKSHKIVKFPMKNFDPSPFLVPRDPQKIRELYRKELETHRVRTTSQETSMSSSSLHKAGSLSSLHSEGSPTKSGKGSPIHNGLNYLKKAVSPRLRRKKNSVSPMPSPRNSPTPSRKSSTASTRSNNSNKEVVQEGVPCYPGFAVRSSGSSSTIDSTPSVSQTSLNSSHDPSAHNTLHHSSTCSSSTKDSDSSSHNGHSISEVELVNGIGDGDGNGTGPKNISPTRCRTVDATDNHPLVHVDRESDESSVDSLDTERSERERDLQRWLEGALDTAHIRYDLFAISCHTGILGGGHYVSYAKNPNGKWYCYNDSSCKEVHPDQIDTDSAYMLFYERQGMDYKKFLPDIQGKQPVNTDPIDDELENEMKKCVIQ